MYIYIYRSLFPHATSHTNHSSSQPLHNVSKLNRRPSSWSEQTPNDVNYNIHLPHFSSAASVDHNFASAASVDHNFCRDRASSNPVPNKSVEAACPLGLRVSDNNGVGFVLVIGVSKR